MLYCLLSSFSAIEHNFHYILVEYSTASNPSHMFFLNSKAIHLFGSMGICRREAKAKLNTTRVEKLDSCSGFRSPGLNRVHVKKGMCRHHLVRTLRHFNNCVFAVFFPKVKSIIKALT